MKIRKSQKSFHPRRPSFPDRLTDPQLLARVAAFYRHRLAYVPTAQATLAAWGLSPDVWDAFTVGLADSELATRLTTPLRHRLIRLGLLTRTGQDVLNGCVVVPLHHPRHGVQAFVGLPLDGGPERSVRRTPDTFPNLPALRSKDALILAASVRDVLQHWHAGRHRVTCLGTSLDSLEALQPLRTVWKGTQVRLCPSLDVTDATLQSIVHELQAQGVHLVRLASSADNLGTRVPGRSLDLALWQTRFADYLVVQRYRTRSREGFMVELRRFVAYLHSQDMAALTDLTPAHVEGYRLTLFYATWRSQRLSLSTQAHRLSAVKVFTRFLYQAGWTLTDPGASVPAIAVPRRLPAVWLSAEVTTLLETPTLDGPLALRNRAILELFYSTGLRNSELCQLTLDAVELPAQQVCVRHGKRDTQRLLPLGEDACYWLARYLDEVRPFLTQDPAQTPLFLSLRGEPFCRISLAAVVRATAAAAGLTKRVSPHVLRHACATHMLHRGAGLRHVHMLLGHVSPATTERYTRVDISDLQAMHAQFHPRGA
jgi:integrase/recombinase XerD